MRLTSLSNIRVVLDLIAFYSIHFLNQGTLKKQSMFRQLSTISILMLTRTPKDTNNGSISKLKIPSKINSILFISGTLRNPSLFIVQECNFSWNQRREVMTLGYLMMIGSQSVQIFATGGLTSSAVAGVYQGRLI